MIYNLFWFDKNGKLFSTFNYNYDPSSDTVKLVYGLVHSLQNIVQKLSPNDSLQSFSTDKYKLHFYESQTGLKIVLVTSPMLLNINLDKLYVIYVETVVKNFDFNAKTAQNKEMFRNYVDSFIKSLSCF